MSELIRTLQGIVGKQFVDLKRSLCGNYVLSATAKKLAIDHHQWAGMSQDEHRAAFHGLLRFRVCDTRTAQSTDDRLTMPVVSNAGKKVGQKKERRQERTRSKLN